MLTHIKAHITIIIIIVRVTVFLGGERDQGAHLIAHIRRGRLLRFTSTFGGRGLAGERGNSFFNH